MNTKNELAEAIVVERTFNAPVARVWRALTDVDQMRQWYFDLKEFKPEVGFEFDFAVEHEGNRYHHLCKVTEVIPQKKIAYTWRYKGEPGDSLVTLELFPESNMTRLRLTHEGLETFPETPAYARKNFEAGWAAIIGHELKEFMAHSWIQMRWQNGFRVTDSPARSITWTRKSASLTKCRSRISPPARAIPSGGHISSSSRTSALTPATN